MTFSRPIYILDLPFFQIRHETEEVVLTLKIRLRRMGKKKSPFYRIVVADSREAVDGKFKEILGYYDPFKKTAMRLDLERADWWVAKGAKPSETAQRLMNLARKGMQEEELESTPGTEETPAEEEETETEEEQQTEEDS